MHLITRAHHLIFLLMPQDKTSGARNIAEKPLKSPAKENARPTASDGKRTGTVSWDRPATRKDAGKAKETADAASPSSTSESRPIRGEEILILFGFRPSQLSEEPDPRERRQRGSPPADADAAESTGVELLVNLTYK